jgi:hypothetical protein
MKRLFFLLICFSIASSGSAQTTVLNRYGHFIWTQSVLLTPCDKNGKTDDNATPIISEVGQKFVVILIPKNSTDAVITILKYKNAEQQNIYNLKGKDPAYFNVSFADLDQSAIKDSKVNGSLALGVINFPFKYRAQKGLADFSGSFNFGVAIGYTFSHKSYSKWNFSLVSTYSISNIVLDSASATKNQARLVSSNNFTSFSFAFGGLLQYDKVQVGAFVGWDNLNRSNQLTYGWVYQGKPWISVGFGYSIFSFGKTTDATATSQ